MCLSFLNSKIIVIISLCDSNLIPPAKFPFYNRELSIAKSNMD